jgi:hypothetical protein
VAKHCRLIHPRVGHAQGPQVAHPAAREVQFEVDTHLDWWLRILAVAEQRGDAEFRVEPEFGVSGYQRLAPFTCEPVEDLWEINSYVAGRVLEAYRTSSPSRAILNPVPRRLLDVLAHAEHRAIRAKADVRRHVDHHNDYLLPIALAFFAGAAVGAIAILTAPKLKK